MSDPLSVAASVAGLIAVAGKLVSILYQKSIAGAPDSAQLVREEIEGMRMVLTQMETFLRTAGQSPAPNANLIQLHDFLRVVSDCVLTFSSLDKIIDDLSVGNKAPISRLKWVAREDEILKSLERLGRLKTTLGLMFTVLNRLVDTLDRYRVPFGRGRSFNWEPTDSSDSHILHDASQRLKNLELLTTVTAGLRIGMPMAETIERRLDGVQTDFALPSSSKTTTYDSAQTSRNGDTHSIRSLTSIKSFNGVLRTTRVYLNVRRNKSKDTFHSDDNRSATASTLFANVSMDMVSELSFYALPLCPKEVHGIDSLRRNLPP